MAGSQHVPTGSQTFSPISSKAKTPWAEAVRDPPAPSARVFQRGRQPTAGESDSVAPPLSLSGYELRSDRIAPELGADGEAVLAEAGLDGSEIAAALATEEPG